MGMRLLNLLPVKKVGCTQSYKLASILCDSLDELITWVEILNFFS